MLLFLTLFWTACTTVPEQAARNRITVNTKEVTSIAVSCGTGRSLRHVTALVMVDIAVLIPHETQLHELHGWPVLQALRADCVVDLDLRWRAFGDGDVGRAYI
jgi:hypothetical protein